MPLLFWTFSFSEKLPLKGSNIYYWFIIIITDEAVLLEVVGRVNKCVHVQLCSTCYLDFVSEQHMALVIFSKGKSYSCDTNNHWKF